MIILKHAGSLSYTISTIRTTTYCYCEKKLWKTIFCKGRGSQDRERRGGYVSTNGRWEGMLGVAASLLAVVQMQQLQAMLGPAVHRGKGMTYNFGNNVQCECVASTMLEELRKRIQNCCATLRRSRNERNVKRCWLKSLTGFKLCARATTCNKVYKRMQHVSSNNVGSCWPGKLCPFAQGFTWQKRRKKRVTGLNRQEDSPETSSRLSVMPWGAKRMPA